MAYATQSDIEKRYGAGALLAATDRDGDGVADTDAVSRALNDATEEIDTYVGARYALPLPTTPSSLVWLCVDIALYKACADASTVTEERRTRYEDAVSLLRRIAKGEAVLGSLPTAPVKGGGVHVSGPPRRFRRGGRGLP